jgi:hypothetical protein
MFLKLDQIRRRIDNAPPRQWPRFGSNFGNRKVFGKYGNLMGFNSGFGFFHGIVRHEKVVPILVRGGKRGRPINGIWILPGAGIF